MAQDDLAPIGCPTAYRTVLPSGVKKGLPTIAATQELATRGFHNNETTWCCNSTGKRSVAALRSNDQNLLLEDVLV